jgi:hypothetical protein
MADDSKGRRERNIRRELPTPIELSSNSLTFPLGALVEWHRPRSPHLAKEFETLAYSQAVNLRPDSVEKTPAKRLSQAKASAQTKVVYGAVRQATEEEAAVVCAARVAQLEASIKALFADLNPIRSLGVAYGLFTSLRPWSGKTIAALRTDIQMLKGYNGRGLAIGVLAATPEDRAALRQSRIDPNKTKDAA